MNKLKKYVNWKLTHSDKVATAEGYPLTMQNCKANKKMKQLEIYGNSVQDGTPTPDNPIEVQSVGELVTDVNDANYGKYKIPLVQRGINLFSMAKAGLTEQTINGITFKPLDDERVHIKGKIIDNTQDAIYNPPLKTNTTIKADIYNLKSNKYIGNGLTLMIGMRTTGGAWLINLNAISTNQTLTKNGVMSSLYLGVTKSSTKEWDDIIPIQITKGTGTKSLPYEPYAEPVTTNIFLNEPLRKISDCADYVDFKNKKAVHYLDGVTTEEFVDVDLPKLTAKTTIIEVDTSLAPSNIYGKYIKK